MLEVAPALIAHPGGEAGVFMTRDENDQRLAPAGWRQCSAAMPGEAS
jgi:hypothetical protein